ncbi:MAG: VOC family protein [Anaerolineaceae bacterium]|nr:VOC family protein [Anaerolineaceae bacterium]
MNDIAPLIGDAELDQIGIVVNDLHVFTQELSRLFGIGPFRIIEWPLEGIDPQATYHGRQADFRLFLAFISLGKIQIEVVQPLEGQNIYSDFLRDHGPGLHHFRLSIPGFDNGVEALIKDGIEKIASGTGVHVGSRWAYFDTTHKLEGVTVELRTRLEDAGGEGKWVQSSSPPDSKE